MVRVNKAEVFVEEKLFSSINNGIALFIGLEQSDDDAVLNEMAEKVVNLRIFENENAKLTYSLKDKNYAVLCIPNFTLCADVNKGRRPSFDNALPREQADRLFENFTALLDARTNNVKKAAFGQHMRINLDCDGPVNIIIEITKKS